jgi:uncharacterized protein (TIGR00661 family)
LPYEKNPVAPLNWGLGHATRCIPIIEALLSHRFVPVLASDGAALKLLTKEFPELDAIELPSYNISYAKKGERFKLKMLQDSPHLIKTIKREKAATKAIVKTYNIEGIISDNRFGVRSKKVPSVFITHQLRVLSGSTTWLSTALHQKIISKFTECWVPDQENEPNLSGDLGHQAGLDIPLKYLGPLSRFKKSSTPVLYKLMVLLSGPEPQRTMLEEKLLGLLEDYPHPCLFVKGCIEAQQNVTTRGNLTIYNYLTTEMLESAINSSELVLCRSGYTTVMDLAKLEKKAFFIPTPGQFEQVYLAERFLDLGIAPCASQDDFELEWLNETKNFTGFKAFRETPDYSKLFHLFEGK